MKAGNRRIKKIVRESYAKFADKGCGCSCNCSQSSNEELAKSIGYSEAEINTVPDANLGLGCGNPTALGEIKEGMTVLDLGSGAGFDCFLDLRIYSLLPTKLVRSARRQL